MHNTNDSMLSQLYTYDTAINDYHVPVISKPIQGQPTVPLKKFSQKINETEKFNDTTNVFKNPLLYKNLLLIHFLLQNHN